MANTPLELYEQAYRLQYHEKRISDAIKIYEAIIRDFPDSNECGYAVIQLQKVKAREITRALKKGPANMYPLLIVSFMSSFIALLVALVGVLLLFQQVRLEHHRTTLAMAALGKMYCGMEENALKILDELKGLSPKDPLSLELTSDIYRKYNQAVKEAPLSPSPATPSMDSATSAPLSVAPAASRVKETPPRGKSTTAIAPEIKRSRLNKTPPKTRTTKTKKGILLVDPDSLSYF